MPGVGLASVIMATGGDLNVSVFEVSPMLASGIALSDTQCFLDTPSGQRYAKDHSMVVVIPDAHVLFVPAGFVHMVSYVATQEEVAAQSFAYALYLTALA